MSAIVNAVVSAGTSQYTQSSRPLAKGYVKSSLLSTPAEGYAQACVALANAVDPAYDAITATVLIVAGEEDKTAPKPTIEFLQSKIKNVKVETLEKVGHWHMLENVEETAGLLKSFTA